jgi:pyruvate dehydrogenase E2 component (dihydrolipoamide acetyltransferase)
MAYEIVVPRLGWSMDEGTFRGWLKRDGEPITEGEPLFALEGDKATEEIAATDSGTLRIAPGGPAEGDVVVVGHVLGHLLAAGEAVAAPIPPQAVSAARTDPSGPSAEHPAPALVAGPASVEAAPAATTTAPRGDRRVSTPRARRIARELGVDWTRLVGSGAGGRIREADVRLHAVSVPAPDQSGSTRLPLTPLRRAIAERLTAALRAAAPVTLTSTVDATNLVSLRTQFRAADPDGLVPGYTDLIVKLCGLALRGHPLLRARWEADHLAVNEAIDIGVAVDAEAGLYVPVLRDVPALPLREVARQGRALAERARSGKLAARDAQGACFTVTNLGGFGIEAFTPLLPGGTGAILGVGRIAREAVVFEERVAPRDRLTLSLTFDHRVLDGAPAARFLQELCRGIENPAAWLVP